ncbi:MAG: AAA family ATPase [Nitrososphaerota archaeon]|jgi:lon-related putative ATP-dependent protease|nr:AAA family ATPase [Nitrososphaerota archaeon]
MQCTSTGDLTPLTEIIGQDRAVRALKFGLAIKNHGFNMYVAGYSGTGRKTAVKSFVEAQAKVQPVPSDWLYVNNFSNQYEPKAIELPRGRGREFRDDMKNFIENIKNALPKAFESEDYVAKRETTLRGIENKRKQLIDQLTTKAQSEGFVIQTTPMGLLLIPVLDGKPLSEEEMLSLSQDIKTKLAEKREKLEKELSYTMRQLIDMERQIQDTLKKLNKEVALYAIGNQLQSILEKYKAAPEAANYLKAAENDILDNLQQFARRSNTAQQQLPIPMPWIHEDPYKKYEVNLVIDNSETKGAPVVMETNPTYHNLLGRTEKEAQFGALTTDFSMIRGGSIHKANGGYLIISVEELLRNPFSYDGLKRNLKDGHIIIEEPEERYGFLSVKTIKPQPIPLTTKIILIGDPNIYQIMFSYDPDFRELFKIKAEFDTTMPRTDEKVKAYSAFVCALCDREHLKHLDNGGLAKIVEYSSRVVEDQQKLSTQFSVIADAIRESNFYAAEDNSEFITAQHVKRAIEEKIFRNKLMQEKIQEMISRGFFLIDTTKQTVGQVNGLSVMSLGDFAFGIPSRVTASIGLGREGVVDIEREAKMGGPIHTKGVLILSGYLNDKYARDKPLGLSARLVFEQSYSGVEGDSASSTELYSLLSALSGIPIKQSIAVTGSVNQKGEVQAIGGVNEKIEGFYEICKAKGLTGDQAVMIPESNVQNLMLKEEVVDAVNEGKFSIYSVKNIDEGIEVLTGKKAGQQQPNGAYEKDTINYLVDKTLQEMADKLREYPTASGTMPRRIEA